MSVVFQFHPVGYHASCNSTFVCALSNNQCHIIFVILSNFHYFVFPDIKENKKSICVFSTLIIHEGKRACGVIVFFARNKSMDGSGNQYSFIGPYPRVFTSFSNVSLAQCYIYKWSINLHQFVLSFMLNGLRIIWTINWLSINVFSHICNINVTYVCFNWMIFSRNDS